MLLHPYFIFDGPDCPLFKEGRGFISAPPLLEQSFQGLLTAFGFSWHTALGQAEAELTYFHLHGLIDAVVSPCNSALLFGETGVIRRYVGEYGDVELYTLDAMELKWGDLLLIVLMSSAEYDSGLPGCGVDIACWVALYGFGRTLVHAASTYLFVEFVSFIAQWHKDLCQHFELACIIEEECTEFPDPTVLAAYLWPVTSWSEGHQLPVTVVTSHQPDLTAHVAFCSQHLDWSMDTIQPMLMDVHIGLIIHALLQVGILYLCQCLLFSSISSFQVKLMARNYGMASRLWNIVTSHSQYIGSLY
ncbi:hypothetical protein J3A83DRAFT_4086223 [Scleroderma citrinum]